MAGNKNSGRGPHIAATATRSKLQDAALKIFHKHMSDPDPDDIRYPSRLRKQIDKLYQWSIGDSKDAVNALKASLEWTLGKAVNPMHLELSNRTPEERAVAFMEALEILKGLQADQAMKEPNGSESVN